MDDIYEPVTKEGAALTKYLVLVWERLGKPLDCSVATGWVMMDSIINIWKQSFPDEFEMFLDELSDDREAERTVHEAVKGGGYIPMSIPTRLYQLIKTLLPQQKLNDRKFIKAMINRYPFMKATNYSV